MQKPNSNFNKRIRNSLSFSIATFLYFYIYAYIEFIEDFYAGYWDLIKNSDGSWGLFLNGVEKPIIWLLVGPKFIFLIFPSAIAFIVFLITLTASPEEVDAFFNIDNKE